jgi:[CysO sulfur-carrier protein]-S-L-cysteine hydrolase
VPALRLRRGRPAARRAVAPRVPAAGGRRAVGAGPVRCPSVLSITDDVWHEVVGHAYGGLPDEACGLLGGDPASGRASVFYPCRNAAASSRVYTVDPGDHLRADRDAEAQGLEIIGVVHSHTHTEAYPSPTDVTQAPDPGWHYVIVSLKRDEAVLRSYRIVDGEIAEEGVGLDEG